MIAVQNPVTPVDRGRRALVLIAFGLTVATGCKTGSWAAKPAWWSFGQSAPAAGEGLAAAPAFSGDASKPSATAKPYPTTSTPQAYALDGSGGPASPVTYGVTPPPPAAPANLAQWSPPAASAAPPGGGSASIGPQVGPYAAAGTALPTPPAALPEAGGPPAALAAVPQSPPPAAVPVSTPRLADARSAAPGWTGSADAVPEPMGRYGVAGSRFSGREDAAVPAAPAADGVPAAQAVPFSAPPPPSTAAPSTVPAEVPAPDGLPPLAPSGPPVRRPDPVYRPGGTSSYRPARTSIAGDAVGGVQPASFESRTSIAP